MAAIKYKTMTYIQELKDKKITHCNIEICRESTRAPRDPFPRAAAAHVSDEIQRVVMRHEVTEIIREHLLSSLYDLSL